MTFIQVIATADNALSSRAIEYWGGGGFSHFASVVDETHVIDSRSDNPCGNGSGVRLRSINYLLKVKHWVWIEIPCAYYKREAWLQALNDQIDKPYDHAGIWSFATGKFRQTDWRDSSAWFCSDLGIYAQEKAGIVNKLEIPGWRITPGVAVYIDMSQPGARVIASR